jgi:hypothetical protein
MRRNLAERLRVFHVRVRDLRPLEEASRNRHEYWPAATHSWLTLRDQLAQLYRRAGQHPDADRVDAELRALLTVADDDHPIKRRLVSGRWRRV